MNKNNQLIELIEKTDLNLNLKKITFDELKNGKVNNSFIINDIENKRKYVLRINSLKSNQFNINRINEVKILNAIKEIEIAPKIIFSDPEYNFLITEFIDGSECRSNELTLHDKKTLKNIINDYQKIKIELPKFNYLEHIRKYEKIAFDKSTINNQLVKKLKKFYPLLEEFQNENWPPVLCHHDLNPSNIIKTNKGMKIIDWEFAGFGHKKYDLHSIGLQDKENFFLDELINIINDLWYEIDNN
tara:strand:+ start:679 stop:1410 length:732 start_codon:yes stop_codon:yes gene_type:complete